MMKRELTCISCPLGCQISVEMEDGNIISVTGNTCPRGERYARQEVLDPRRTVTSTVETEDSIHRRLPVKTVPEIPKDYERDKEAMRHSACFNRRCDST